MIVLISRPRDMIDVKCFTSEHDGISYEHCFAWTGMPRNGGVRTNFIDSDMDDREKMATLDERRLAVVILIRGMTNYCINKEG